MTKRYGASPESGRQDHPGLVEVFRDGRLLFDQRFSDIRERARFHVES